ncbi:DUF6745 domain-containing protein [Nonomuraea sp. NPDC049695]|uniref:DUF6745 domain-containing protein n=1 Tax=Nonomuraea sp. NPDC049695 TaxID=3154734 RepID=UPI00341D08BA
MSDPVQREAAIIREQWLGQALSTLPADRPAAEAAISGLYRLIGLPPPRFHWVASPAAALSTVPPGAQTRESVERMAAWPARGRFEALVRELFRELDARIRPARQPIDRLIQQQVQFPLNRSISATLVPPLRAAHTGPLHESLYWHQHIAWIARYDALRRVAGVAFTGPQLERLGLWATAAASCGWWWPRESVCVVSERPVTVHTEMWGEAGEVRLHCADGPAVRYADGWDLHSWHGTQVPPWVITDPDVRRIADEANVEVRRCAIERLGWAAYIEQAGLRLVASAPDPGNPGSELRLYDMRRGTRVLLAVNGSVERDGRRRRYGLTVPAFLHDPIDAAGWTYGLSAAQYSRLLRRT